MLKKEFYFPSSDGQTQIHVIQWFPEAGVKAVLQISHGMVEYIDRYDEFARYLAERGFCVVGHDHLGRYSHRNILDIFMKKKGISM